MSDSTVSSVGVRELKTRISTYLRLVRKGARVIVTDRGRPVAELCPYQAALDPESILKEMTMLGEVTRLSSRALAPFDPIAVKGEPISQTVLNERQDRLS
jgi:prevent-host-death family protein